MTYTRAQALARARNVETYAVGMCLKFVREQYGIPAAAPDAAGAWTRARRRHGTDEAPPAGVPVFYLGGSAGLGHVAISDGHGGIVGTDAPTRGRVGTVPLDWPERRWGMRRVGWTEDLNGLPIALDQVKPRRPAPVRAIRKAIRAARNGAGPVLRRRLDRMDAIARKVRKR